MDTYPTKPIEELESSSFGRLLNKKEVVVSTHALNHLSKGQRKIFKEEDLITLLNKETPRKVYLQKNNRYACYYRKSDGYRKLIVEVSDKKATIITFIDTIELPKIKI